MMYLYNEGDIYLPPGTSVHIGLMRNGIAFRIKPEAPISMATYVLEATRLLRNHNLIKCRFIRCQDGYVIYETTEDLTLFHYNITPNTSISIFLDELLESIMLDVDQNDNTQAFEGFDGDIVNNYPEDSFIQRAHEDCVIYDVFMFFDLCQKRLNTLSLFPEDGKDYKDLVDVVLQYYKDSLPFIALLCLCDYGVIDRDNLGTKHCLRHLQFKLKGQFSNAGVNSYWRDKGKVTYMGPLLLDPILITIDKNGFYPINFLSIEVYNHLKNFVDDWLKKHSIEEMIDITIPP